MYFIIQVLCLWFVAYVCLVCLLRLLGWLLCCSLLCLLCYILELVVGCFVIKVNVGDIALVGYFGCCLCLGVGLFSCFSVVICDCFCFICFFVFWVVVLVMTFWLLVRWVFLLAVASLLRFDLGLLFAFCVTFSFGVLFDVCFVWMLLPGFYIGCWFAFVLGVLMLVFVWYCVVLVSF